MHLEKMAFKLFIKFHFVPHPMLEKPDKIVTFLQLAHPSGNPVRKINIHLLHIAH